VEHIGISRLIVGGTAETSLVRVRFLLKSHRWFFADFSSLFKMDRFDKLNSYFIKKERSRLDAIAKETKSGLPEMSVEEIKLSCLENGEPYLIQFCYICENFLIIFYFFRWI
jgi:hypothetical protein